METKGKERWRVILIVVAVIVIVAGVILYDSFQTRNATIADNAANTLLNSMVYLGNLPWNVQEFNLRAVMICGDQKIFVKNNQDFGTSALNCGYYIAQGVFVEPGANLWTGEGTIRFAKEAIINE